jgi:2-keto-4-pentenoate hydratase/2-oxohepta-3-ene-1,7-dioic acid hydratase in catechol pathway
MITCRVNGKVTQHNSTKEMIFDPYEYISFVSQVMTLFPGDVLMTGSPKGMTVMQPGDVVEVEVEGLGTIRNRLVAPEA